MYTSIHVKLGLFCDLIRLASGDAEGRVAVWDVASGGVIVALDDALTVTSSCCWQDVVRSIADVHQHSTGGMSCQRFWIVRYSLPRLAV